MASLPFVSALFIRTPTTCFFDTNEKHLVVDTEARVVPAHQFLDQFVCDLSLLLQEFEYLCPEQVFKRFEICLPHDVKCPGVPEKFVCDNGMQVGMAGEICRLSSVEGCSTFDFNVY